ncbi:hypothetical protein MYAM1_001608 [Malassezia yamatoensis]|uniref:Ankyrin n=1 Tax=Malassezia yamatoensis TaxID=253288 RepID=A0AAJ6CH28_9BASI|nr:hypothetical protein MYAM1_001608 [Malassezia yamatoensis]
MADDTRNVVGRQLIAAARSDNVDLYNSVVNAQPDVEYDINFADGLGNTALHYAVENLSGQVFDLILDEEVDVDARNRLDGDTPLHLACKIKNEQARNYFVQELLEAGAPTDTRNRAGLRPVDSITGALAESELGKKCIEMLTMSQAKAQLDTADIAYDDDDIADDGGSDVEY